MAATGARLANRFVLLLFLPATGLSARAAEPGTVAVFWAPPAAPPVAPELRSAFAEATRPMGARFVDASPTPPAALPDPLAPELDAAKAAYDRFDFPGTVAQLTELERRAEQSGGGDLDARQLAELFLYRGLAKLETSTPEAAWDDLVRAARLDPSRVLDPARFPPRAVIAHRRAANEVAGAPRVQLVLDVPPGSAIRVDGAPAAATVPVTAGSHFVAVVSDAHEPWRGLVHATISPTRFTPPLRPYQPPRGDQLFALAAPDRPRRLLLGALEKNEGSWQFTLRDITLPDGRYVSESVRLGEIPSRAAVQGLVRRLNPPPAPARWLPWAIAGGAALLVAFSVTFLVVRDGTSPNVVGDLGPWR